MSYVVVARSVALLSICIAHSVPAVSADCDAGTDGTTQQAEQKIVLLEQLIAGNGSVRRVLESGQTDAIASIEAARELAAAARQQLEAGCAGIAAESAALGLNRATQALWLVQNRLAVGEQEYRALHSRTTSYLHMLEAEPVESQGVGVADLAGIRRQLDRAEVLAINAQYGEAVKLLEPAGDRLERRLVVIREQQAAFNAREFGKPEDEYAYLGEQYRAYLLLLRQLNEGRHLAMSSRRTYEIALQDAAKLNDAAAELAGNGDWQAALTSMRAALNNCQSAIRLIGVTN
jgi:hypothetical protein